jgi:hypothetical protein
MKKKNMSPSHAISLSDVMYVIKGHVLEISFPYSYACHMDYAFYMKKIYTLGMQY